MNIDVSKYEALVAQSKEKETKAKKQVEEALKEYQTIEFVYKKLLPKIIEHSTKEDLNCLFLTKDKLFCSEDRWGYEVIEQLRAGPNVLDLWYVQLLLEDIGVPTGLQNICFSYGIPQFNGEEEMLTVSGMCVVIFPRKANNENTTKTN